jgi:hypothetical protein
LPEPASADLILVSIFNGEEQARFSRVDGALIVPSADDAATMKKIARAIRTACQEGRAFRHR